MIDHHNKLRGRPLWRAAGLAMLLMLAQRAGANSYIIPSPETGVVGEISMVTVSEGETLLDIARRHGLGYKEIKLANPGVDTWLPGVGTEVVLPTQFVLPAAPRQGIVVNVPEMRLYYYPPQAAGEPRRVVTYPISIGRGDWATPLGKTEIVRKDKNPAWRPPESIRAEHAERGDFLPKVVPPGPDNPLGDYSLRLGLPGYLIHGTNKGYGIGMKVTHGCVRLYPEDIDALFNATSVGTPVRLVDQATKAGWRDGRLFLEVHPRFTDPAEGEPTSLTPLVRALREATGAPLSDGAIDWDQVYAMARLGNGIPGAVSAAQSRRLSDSG